MFALLALAAAPLVAASLKTRQSSGAWCDGLGGAAYDVAYNFTLEAHNTSTDSVGTQIVLSPASDGAGAGIFRVATYDTEPSTIGSFPNFTLIHGALRANEPSAPDCAPMSLGADAGAPVSFSGNCSAPATPAQVFCAIPSTSNAHYDLPILALNTHEDLFSICRESASANSSSTIAKDILVYDATTGNDAYDHDSCYAVTLHMAGSY
ncbi:hypothetical protein OE88DRAFT_1808938 [Heliocybe sulcata]|uniref:Uncharacterized protein n=1 Tax=Heliocybe sulcata TaxID=5364 RepID=A0A5C3N3K1_9AGAM|nr:hypothetical protein OE88DRAFT_1808938 [Heliocybe sulcata]